MRHKIQKLNDQNGFIMPSIMIIMVVLAIVGFATALGAQTTFNNAVRTTYNQIAKVASRAAIDYAKEQYDLDANYSGTAETELYNNSTYRVTFEVNVIETVYDFKRIEAIGRLYIPEISSVTEFTRSIEAGIIRDSAGSGSPLDYNPLVWFDASDPNTLLTTSSGGGGGGGGCSATSKLQYEKYDGISGTSISTLTGDPDYPNNPDSSQTLTGQFASPVNVDNNYGARISGILCAPTNGLYTFWVSGDDNSELWLSTNADPSNKTRIAHHTGWTSVNEWDKYSQQQSTQIALNGGNEYYIEALVKEGGGGDHIEVGWQLPDTTLERPIPIGYFSLPSESTTTYADVSIDGIHGSSSGDIVEQRGTDASSNPGRLSWNSNDLEMSWDGSNKGHQWIGLRFRDSGIPQGATITSAHIQFTTKSTQTSGNVSLEIYGRDVDDAGAWSGNFAVSNATRTSNSVTWTPPDWNTVGESGPNQQTPDLTDVVQELVNRSGWGEDEIAFMIGWNSGNGIRRAYSGKNGFPPPQLFVQWEDAGGGGGPTEVVAADGDRITRWLDKSGNSNHAELILGPGGHLREGVLNSKGIVEFTASDTNAYRANLASEVNTDTVTAIVVLRFDDTSSWDARVVSMMDRDSADDWNTPNGAYLMQRDDDTSGVRARNDSDVCVVASQTVVGQFAIFTVHIPPGGSNSEIRLNQVGGYVDPTGCNFSMSSVDEVWFAGRRGGSSMSCVGPNVPIWQDGVKYCQFLDGAISEYIIYDHYLTQSEIAQVEYYLSTKWDIELSPVSGS